MIVDPPSDPNMNERAISILEWAAKAVISLGAIKAFLSGIYKPFVTWRREHTVRTVRDALKPELDNLDRIIAQEESCATRMEEVLEQTRMIFKEFDDVLEVMMDNRDRIDETNGLLDELGLSTERRASDDRREAVQSMVDRLHERRKSRRRGWLHD